MGALSQRGLILGESVVFDLGAESFRGIDSLLVWQLAVLRALRKPAVRGTSSNKHGRSRAPVGDADALACRSGGITGAFYAWSSTLITPNSRACARATGMAATVTSARFARWQSIMAAAFKR